MTALHWASRYGYSSVVKALLAGGADIHLVDNVSWSGGIFVVHRVDGLRTYDYVNKCKCYDKITCDLHKLRANAWNESLLVIHRIYVSCCLYSYPPVCVSADVWWVIYVVVMQWRISLLRRYTLFDILFSSISIVVSLWFILLYKSWPVFHFYILSYSIRFRFIDCYFIISLFSSIPFSYQLKLWIEDEHLHSVFVFKRGSNALKNAGTYLTWWTRW